MKLLGVDYGKKRVGFAIGYEETGLAVPHAVESCQADSFVDLVHAKATQEEVELIVLGLPVHADGRISALSKKVTRFAEELEAKGWAVVLIDERFSSRVANQNLTALGLNAKQRRGRVDDCAAQVILQSYLDQQG